MSAKTIKLELSVEEARALVPHIAVQGTPAFLLSSKLGEALAAHEQDEKRAALWLPWSVLVPTRLGPPFAWGVSWNPTKGEEPLVPHGLTEAQAKLMATAPGLAEDAVTSRELLMAWLRYYGLQPGMGTNTMDAHSAETRQHIKRITEHLTKASWIEGDA